MSREFWDQSFSSDQFVYGETPNKFVQEMSSLIPNQSKVSCFAEGEGRNAVYLATLGHDVTSYDLSTVGLEKTKHLAGKHHVAVKTIAKDLTKDSVTPNQYDAAVMIYGHVPKSEQPFFLAQMINSVKSNGLVMFEVYSEEQLEYRTGGPRSIDMLYNPQDILQWINPHKCLHFYYGEAKRFEGERHTGLGHIIQVILQKN